jgi:hypothetical protein
MNNELFNFEEMSLEQLQALQAQTVQVQLKKIADQMEYIRDEQKKYQARTEIRLEEQEQKTKSELLKIEELAKATSRSNEPRYGWITATHFGQQFTVPMSNQRVGKLLRIVGLAQKSKNKTTPYFQNLGKERFAINEVFNGNQTTLWNYKRCMGHIDLWLDKNGHYTEFYSLISCGTETQLARFIDQMHRDYVESQR